jgi:hypothetical protein
MKNQYFSNLSWITNIIILNCVIEIIHSQGNCGPANNSMPGGPQDCVPYSNSTDFCCFLNATNSPALFTRCINMKNTDVYSILTVGSMRYDVDCHGIKDYEKYFPFEAEYSACGYSHPSVSADCWRFNTDSQPCCLASTEPTFNPENNPLCYFFPEDSDFSVKNYTKTNKQGVKLYFSCHGGEKFFTPFIFLVFTFALLIY